MITPAFIVVFVLLLGILAVLSYADRLYSEMGRFLSREFQENIEIFEKQVEPRLGAARPRAALSFAVLTQLASAALALIVGYLIFGRGAWSSAEILQGAIAMILIVLVFNRLLPYVFFARTRGAWLVPLAPVLRGLIYLALPVTVLLGFCLSVVALAEEQPPEEPERPSEAVDALIEAGQEEGILQESDRQLIQSVVEFGDKTVRDVMTARPEVFAVPVTTTVEQLTEMLRTRTYSRVPVFEGNLDQIKGIIFAHDVLQIPDVEARTRTVAAMMRPAYFVPETKPVSELLREMQKENQHMALVIDEYGGVAGLVTIEDMVEEIVGEIRDEHEARPDIVREAEHRYVVPGNMDIDRLDELFGFRPESRGSATVGGLVSELLGRIPQPGEILEQDGLRFEVLQATRRRVERVRISSSNSQQASLKF